MKQKWLSLLSIFCAAALLLTACGGTGTEDNSSLDSPSSVEESPSDPVSSEGASSESENGESGNKQQGGGTIASSLAQGTSTVQASSTPEAQTVRITFAEGVTVARIIDTLVEKKVTEQKAMFDALESADLSAYPLVNAITMGNGRCFRLEGYLFPDTYEFYVGESPASILKKMLDNTEKKLTQEFRNRASELGRSMDEILTIASIVQKETGQAAQMPEIASIIYNRLEQGMRLQCDVTITYVEGAIKPYIDGDVNRYNSYYNTYKCAALPAGPICNPGMTAIKAALWPDSTKYLFFAYDTSGNYYYASTYEEHLENLADAGIS